MFLLGIFVIAVALHTMSEGLAGGATMYQLIWGLLPIAFGLWLLTKPGREYWRGLRTLYAVTNQRLLILNGIIRRTVESYPPFYRIECHERSDGSGTVTFAERVVATGRHGTRTEKVGFFDIPDVRNVENLIWQLNEEER